MATTEELNEAAASLLDRFRDLDLGEVARRLALKFGEPVVYWPGVGWRFAGSSTRKERG